MLIAEGDKVAAYATYAGMLTGPMVEFPAPGKSVESKFLSFFRIEEGRIAEIGVHATSGGVMNDSVLYAQNFGVRGQFWAYKACYK